MKILILPSWYPNNEDKTYGVFVKEQAKALIKSGLEVRVYYPFDKSISTKGIVNSTEDGIITYRSNTDYIKNSKISRVNSAIQAVRQLSKIRKEYDFDLIHCHVCYFSGIIAYFFKKLYGTKYVITEHMSYVGDYAKKVYDNFLLSRAYRSADAVICVSEFLKDKLNGLGFRFNDVIIANVVDTETFTIGERKDDGFVNILFTGSMDNDEVKGIKYLLKAFAILSKERSDCRLHIIGDGVKRNEYEKMAEELGLNSVCCFYGKKDRKTLAKFMQSASFFVLPSKYEMFGTVVAEAMACGTPVLVTDRGGHSEHVKDIRHGYKVKPEDVDSLYKGLKYMTENYANYDREFIHEYAVEHFSFDNVTDGIKQLYKTII